MICCYFLFGQPQSVLLRNFVLFGNGENVGTLFRYFFINVWRQFMLPILEMLYDRKLLLQ